MYKVVNKNNGESYDILSLLGMMMHMCNLLFNLGYKTNPINHVGLSNRMTKTLALTHKKNGIFWIDFNTKFLATADDKSIREVAMHEAIHLIDGCLNHGKKFKEVANIVNTKYGFNVGRTFYDKGYHDERIQMKAQKPFWTIKCGGCGKVVGPWYRAGKVVKSCMKGEKRFSCKRCGSKDLRVFHTENGMESQYWEIHI